MSTLLLVAIILAANLFISTLFIWLGARLVKAPRASFRRAFVVACAIFVLSVLLLVLTNAYLEVIAAEDWIVQVAILVGAALISCVVIRSLFRTTLLRALAVWVFNLTAGGIAAVVLVLGIIRPFLLEAFVISANSMAPTIVGWHAKGICPHCERMLIVPVSLAEGGVPLLLNQDRLGICVACRKTNRSGTAKSATQVPDRVAVNKLLAARRWDMVVFRYPVDPSLKYVDRLVGLPGETVFINDGSIWVNGTRIEPPVDLAGLRYTTEVEGGSPIKFGTEAEPWRLERDHYVVLADFSENGSDSRFWGPVPAANIEGVVGLCYWPANRWRLFR